MSRCLQVSPALEKDGTEAPASTMSSYPPIFSAIELLHSLATQQMCVDQTDIFVKHLLCANTVFSDWRRMS